MALGSEGANGGVLQIICSAAVKFCQKLRKEERGQEFQKFSCRTPSNFARKPK